VLGDPEKRRKYDVLGSDWQHAAKQAEQQRRYRHAQAQAQAQSADSGGFDFGNLGASGFSDFFDMFFSGIGRGASGRRFAQRGGDLETTIDLSIADTFNGGKKPVSLQVEDACPRCGASGVLSGGSLCPQCGGTGHIVTNKRFDITIPKGVHDGQRIRLAGQGGTGTGGAPNGDLYLVVHVADNDRYQRKGDDLYIDFPISIYDLILGGKILVPTMTGEVTVTIPPGTQNNKLLRLAGKGMPKTKSGGFGDEYVRLIGQLPPNMTDEERELFRRLAAMRNGAAKAEHSS
jgi:DnaJ-class molecular chaperone